MAGCSTVSLLEKRYTMIHTRKKFLILASALLFSVFVGSCGVKPKSLSAPEGAENNTFPRTYPDLKHDPQPEE